MNCEYKKAFYAALKKSCPTGKMVLLCCVCNKVIEYVGTPNKDCEGMVSHGLHPECAKKVYPEFCEDGE